MPRLLALLLAIALGLHGEAAGFAFVALGDSIAAGVGDGGAGGYAARYRTAVEGDLGVTVTLQNRAVPGSTSQDLLAALTGDTSLRAAVVAADLLTLDIGGNDILIGYFAFRSGTCGGSDGQDCLRQAVTVLGSAWAAIVAELRTLNPAAMMRTMSYYNPFVIDPGDGSAAVARTYVGALNAIIRTTAPGFGIGVAEAALAFNGARGTEDPAAKGYLDFDGIHPSPLGHTVLGDAFRALGYPPPPGTLVRIPAAIGLKDDVVAPIDPTRRKLSVSASTRKGVVPANRIVPPPPGGPQDPRTAGAVVTVYNAAGLTADHVVLTLPPTGWTLLGASGFRFKGPGPVTQVLVAPDKLKVKAGGAGFGYSLDEPAQGAVAVRVTFGGGGWCGATSAIPKTDVAGKFIGARGTPAPVVCPGEAGSASGAFVARSLESSRRR